ncbi:MAG TPA: DUF2513 domain-containing protein [Terriglobales bacterium]|nr:DUF2513 domain-containing protein [Terriglobales bacterium]
MQRDLDLIRDMLLQLEKLPCSVQWYEIVLPGRSRQELCYHAKLAHDAGLIEARFLPGTTIFMVHRLTNKGHEFLDAAREDTIWKRAKETALKTAGTLTVIAVETALKFEVQQAVTSAPDP